MDITREIEKLAEEIKEHDNLSNHHAYQAKIKEAKKKKLEKQFEKLVEIINEQLPPAV
jgi:hypothetical protein